MSNLANFGITDILKNLSLRQSQITVSLTNTQWTDKVSRETIQKLNNHFENCQVDPQSPHSEYPRPGLTREEWLNLNGQWDFQIIEKYGFKRFKRK